MEISGRGGDELQGLLLNPPSPEISSSDQNAFLAAGLRPDPLRELKHFPDLIFSSLMHQKRLAAGPDPREERGKGMIKYAFPQIKIYHYTTDQKWLKLVRNRDKLGVSNV